jgi:hypothetical protein
MLDHEQSLFSFLARRLIFSSMSAGTRIDLCIDFGDAMIIPFYVLFADF